MVDLYSAPTKVLSSGLLREIRALLDRAFDGDFTDEDWDHCVGGHHVWLTAPNGVISHGSLVERTLVCSGKTLRVGFVEAVATEASHRRLGYGARVMGRIGELIFEGYPLGVLSTGTHAFYETLGWERWRGPTYVEGLKERRRTADDDGDVMILRTPMSPQLNLDEGIVCDWRRGDVW